MSFWNISFLSELSASEPSQTQTEPLTQTEEVGTEEAVDESGFHPDSYTRQEVANHRPLLSQAEVLKRGINKRLDILQNGAASLKKSNQKQLVGSRVQFEIDVNQAQDNYETYKKIANQFRKYIRNNPELAKKALHLLENISQEHETYVSRRSTAIQQHIKISKLHQFRASAAYLHQKHANLPSDAASRTPSSMTEHHITCLKNYASDLKEHPLVNDSEHQYMQATIARHTKPYTPPKKTLWCFRPR